MCAQPTLPQKRLLAAGAVLSDQGWGTAEALVALSGMLIEEDGGLARAQPYLPAKESDTPFVKEGDLGNIEPVNFAPAFTMRYDPGGLGVLIAQLFGKAGTPTNAGGDAERHTFEWEPENYGEFSTFAIERPNKIFEVPSVKPLVLDLNIADGFLKGTIGLRGNTLINTGLVNTDSEFDALTYADRGHRIKFSQMEVKMNAESGQDVILENALELSDISLHYERPMDSPHRAGSQYIIEPSENSQSIITITMTFPRMNSVNDAFFASFIAETEQKIRIEIIGDVISAPATYFLRMMFQRMRIISIDYPFSDVVPATITLQAEQAASPPSGMGLVVPYWELQNKRSVDYLD